MIRMRPLFSGLIITFSLAGCVSQNMYYYGNYSQTLYSYEKNQTEEAYTNHKQELERVIAESETRNLPIPPGIYAELGYINLKENNSPEAIRLFNIESQLYPESRHLMTRLIESAESRESTEKSLTDISITKNKMTN